MRISLIVILLQLFTISFLKAQDKNDVFYLFKSDWNAAQNVDEATYFMQAVKESDSAYICRYYRKNGPMVRQESYSDKDFIKANGRFCWYNAKGNLDSTGLVVDGKKDRTWNYFKDDKKIATEYFENGHLIERKDYAQNFYINNEGVKISLDEKVKQDSIERTKTDTTIEVVQIAAAFKGGIKGWTKYLQNNLKTPERLINILGQGEHSVGVYFLVNKEGNTSDIYLYHSVEWSGDTEVFRIIKNSPKWEPAQQNGKKVYYGQKQSLTFAVR